MNLMRKVARLTALVLGVQLIASCDTRLPTSSGNGVSDDIERPQISFAVSGSVNNVVDLGASINVTINASDNNGVASLLTRVSNASQVLGVDTATIKPTQLRVSRALSIPTGGLARGDRVTIRTTVADGALNVATDSIIITIADTVGPNITVTSSKANHTVKGRDTLDVRVSASDSSGIRYAGYRLLRIRATDSVLVKAESTFVTATSFQTVFATPVYNYVIPDTLLTGAYTAVGFALDRSGVYTKVGQTSVNFTVVDNQKPKLTLTIPTKLNVGDSMIVQAHLQDNISVQRLTIIGVSARGNPSLGTADTIVRYPLTSIPANTNFPLGVRDTVVQRYIKVFTPLDTVTDSLIVTAVLTDAANNADTVRSMVKMVSGPNVVFISPVLGDSANRGGGMTVNLKATSTPGVLTLGFRVQSEPGFPTPIDTTISAVYSPALKLATLKGTIKIPLDAPPKGLITITPTSLDVNGQDGSSIPMIIAVRAGTPPGPAVTQVVSNRVETRDTITVTAIGNGIAYVGFEVRDATSGAIYKRDSVAITGSPSSVVQGLQLNLSNLVQGKRVEIISFAYDDGGRVGYSLRAGVTTPQPAYGLAASDQALVVYGHTYTLPTQRNGTIADLAVDPLRGNVFLSNINYGRLEVWQRSSQSFDPNGVVVGSQPWGMTMSRFGAKDTLYVANSGGTNLSKVYVGAASPSGMSENLSTRLKTRISLLYRVTEVRDASTGKIRINVIGPFLFSDRPQFVEQGSSGLLYLSTKPTAAAPAGTVRYLNPSKAAPDERFMLDFALPGNDPNSWLIANVDGVSVTPAPATSTLSDQLTICDHTSGTTNPSTCASSLGGVAATVAAVQAAVPGTDIDARPNLDETSLSLTDTTFAASSGDGKVITFGQGNTKGGFAKNFLAFDDPSSPDAPTSASPAINISDLINNAADEIFGVALDKSGQTIGIHGRESYFAAVAFPFTQRLQGKKSTFNAGAGIAFHPNADGISTPQKDRLAFVASANGTIEAIDIAYYDFSRGNLATKYNLYGPLRASLPFPGDDPTVVLKLFGLAPTGLVVIDVTAADLLAGP